MKKIAILASGAGSNAKKIIDRFRNSDQVKVALIGCNRPGAGVLGIAEKEGIPSFLIEKENFFRGDFYLPLLQKNGIEFIILAGFLWKIPDALIKAYPRKIINIHPALLPRFGGKGMYGNFVHQAVKDAKAHRTGITIHYVDEQYDHGDIIFQASCRVHPRDTAASIAKRIHKLEHAHFPVVLERIIGNGKTPTRKSGF